MHFNELSIQLKRYPTALEHSLQFDPKDPQSPIEIRLHLLITFAVTVELAECWIQCFDGIQKFKLWLANLFKTRLRLEIFRQSFEFRLIWNSLLCR